MLLGRDYNIRGDVRPSFAQLNTVSLFRIIASTLSEQVDISTPYNTTDRLPSRNHLCR